MKVGRASLSIAALLLAMSVGPAFAQAPPIRAEGGDTQYFQGRAFRTFSKFVFVNRVLTDGKEQPNPQDLRVRAFVQVFAFNLAPAPNLNFTFIAPVASRRFENVVQPGDRTLSGFGDLTIQGKYRFWKRIGENSRTDFAAVGGVKLPTGPTGARDSSGNRLPIPAQIGTGSTDLYVEFGALHRDSLRGFGLFADLRYTEKTAGKGYTFGDTWDVDWGANKRLYPWKYTEAKPVELYTEVSFLYSHGGRDRNGATRIAASGGDAVYWAPGATAIIKQRVLLEASFQFPISQRLNRTQLGQGWNVLFGTRIIY